MDRQFVPLWSAANAIRAISQRLRQGMQRHPPQLLDLALINMWETFSFFGTRSILVFYMVKQLEYADSTAIDYYGAFTGLVFGLCVAGGIIGDRCFSRLTTVGLGCFVVMLGNITLAIEALAGAGGFVGIAHDNLIFLALALLAVGVGLMKPNTYTLLGRVYAADEVRREAGFLLFYSGVSLSSLVAIMVCGALAVSYGYHVGFGLAALGQVIGIAIIVWRRDRLCILELRPDADRSTARPLLGVLAIVLLVAGSAYGIRHVAVVGWFLVAVGGACLAFIVWHAVRTPSASVRMGLLAVIPFTAAAALFWTLVEQGGGALSLFADKHVNLSFFEIPITASQTQALAPFFVLLLAPAFAVLWPSLVRRRRDPGPEWKFVVGFLAVALALVLLTARYALAEPTELIGIGWLVATYLLFTVGDLLIVPIGSALIARVSPPAIGGTVFGFWTIGLASGNYLAAYVAVATSQATGGKTIDYSLLLGVLCAVAFAGAAILAIASPWLRRLVDAGRASTGAGDA